MINSPRVNIPWGILMFHRRYLGLAFFAAASIFAPLQASALSVNDFEKMTAQQETAYYNQVVSEAIQQAFKVDQQTGVAVGKYFTTIQPGSSQTEGFTAFDAELQKELA